MSEHEDETVIIAIGTGEYVVIEDGGVTQTIMANTAVEAEAQITEPGALYVRCGPRLPDPHDPRQS